MVKVAPLPHLANVALHIHAGHIRHRIEPGGLTSASWPNEVRIADECPAEHNRLFRPPMHNEGRWSSASSEGASVTPKKSTIYDLARIAETSASTVSAILNGTWQERRVSSETAERVLALADKLKYTVNRQARGLRRSRSGLIGMIIPMHDNRFFSAMSQKFEELARARGLHPMVVSTLRDPKLEVETVETLLSYQVEHLLVTGATDPDAVSKVCRHHGVPHVNVDLPGRKAPSVITDNHWGAQQLTSRLIERSTPQSAPARDRVYFVGGIASDHATSRRIDGFTAAIRASFGTLKREQINACGYEPERAEAAVAALHAHLGGLPRGLFVNSTIALEGVVRFLKTLPHAELEGCAIGSYDWDPFCSFLSFPLLMVRQNIDGLMGEAFNILDSGEFPKGKVVEILPELVLSR
jgi:LacI family transcriptional regulator, fructose operon transcriptional repressor